MADNKHDSILMSSAGLNLKEEFNNTFGEIFKMMAEENITRLDIENQDGKILIRRDR